MPERAHTHTHTFTPMETMWMSVQFLANPEDRQAKKTCQLIITTANITFWIL